MCIDCNKVINKKYTTKYVIEIYQGKGCNINNIGNFTYSNQYVNIPYYCPKNHLCQNTDFKSFKNKINGYVCNECSGRTLWNEEKVIKHYEDKGCKIIDKEVFKYEHAHQKIPYLCPKKHLNTQTAFNCFLKKDIYVCLQCSDTCPWTTQQVIKLYENRKCTIKNVQNFTFKNSNQKIPYYCKENHLNKNVTFSSFLKKTRCSECHDIITWDTEKVIEIYILHDMKIVNENIFKYKNNRQIIPYKCVKGHLCNNVSFDKFLQKKFKCKCCNKENNKGENHHRYIERTKQYIDKVSISNRYRRMLKHLLSETNIKKSKQTNEYLHYSQEDLYKYLQDHLSNQICDIYIGLLKLKYPEKKTIKQVEHYFPVANFIKYNIIDPKIVHCLDNLSYMEKYKNLSKHDYVNPYEFKKWLKEKWDIDIKINWDFHADFIKFFKNTTSENRKLLKKGIRIKMKWDDYTIN